MVANLLEITLSNWTPTVKNPTYKTVNIFWNKQQIIMTQLMNYKTVLPSRIISEYPFTPLEIEMLRRNLETVKKFTHSFVISLPSLGLEHELENCIRDFETFVKNQKKEITETANAKIKETILKMQTENENYQRELAQLRRNYNAYKSEFNDFVADYNRLFDSSLFAKYSELLKRNKELEDLFQKEKFEKEQFREYCKILNEKMVAEE